MVKRVGVIGGGQLAWMMAEAAQSLGIELVIQTPQATDPAVAIASQTVLAPVADAEATAKLSRLCDVITFENEFVDLEALSRLANHGVLFYPRLTSLAPLLDKYHQRAYLRNLGIPTPQFQALSQSTDAAFLERFGLPAVLKVRRHGYDGQGTVILKQPADAMALLHSPTFTAADWLIEEFVPFERELAVIAARSLTGETALYPVVETQQEQQVCRRVFATEDFNLSVVEQVNQMAQALLTSLDYVGVMGIECFLTREGQVLVNELAPRTHNSGHYTLDACATSQFEQQLRAVCGLPLGSSTLTSSGAVMVNLLGYEVAEHDYLEQRQRLANIPNAHVYWYGKTQSRPGRKLGHVTVILQPGQNRVHATEIAETIEGIWYPAKT